MGRSVGSAALLVGLLFIAVDALAQPASSADRLGSVYAVRIQRESETTGIGSSGSSHDVWSLTERVISSRDGGVELEFDLPADTSADERRRAWQFPARAFKPGNGPLVLLNASDAEQRLRKWLDKRELALCGHWVFGWTAQKIECDPQSVLALLEPYLQPADLREGAMYCEPGALRAVPLQIQASASGGPILVARMEIDAAVVRHQRAESDLAVAEMMHRPPLSLDAALGARAGEQISGTIVATFEMNQSGSVTRRIRVTETSFTDQSRGVEHETTTETTDWTPAAGAPPR